MRVFVAGDVHAKIEWWLRVCEAAQREGCEEILQVGDFGWWPHTQPGAKFIQFVHASLEHFKLRARFIDGNHENFDDLWSHSRTEHGDIELGARLRYLPRGHRWVWAGQTLVALGGAWSHDHAQREPGKSWWEQETLREQDLAEASRASADIVISHDAPSGALGWKGTEDPSRFSYHHRRFVRRVVDAVRPQLVIHGHYHHRYSDHLLLGDGVTVRVEGLGRDGDPDGSGAVLDCGDASFTSVQV